MWKRNYEILLPLKSNDGQSLPPDLFEQTREELIGQFGWHIAHTSWRHQFWLYEGIRYEDNLFRFSVEAEDTDESHQFFMSLKNVLLERFKQVEICVAAHPIETQ